MKKFRTIVIVACMALTLTLGVAFPAFADPAGPQGQTTSSAPRPASDTWMDFLAIVLTIL